MKDDPLIFRLFFLGGGKSTIINNNDIVRV